MTTKTKAKKVPVTKPEPTLAEDAHNLRIDSLPRLHQRAAQRWRT